MDFSTFSFKLLEKNQWTNEEYKEVETQYKAFLYLCFANPGIKLIPPANVDLLWHEHILHTKKYAEDCQNVLGFFLHHLPNKKGETNSKQEKDFTINAFSEIGIFLDNVDSLCAPCGGE